MANMTKPKEFQVVPMPSIFTRGRWECIETFFSLNKAPITTASSTFSPASSTVTTNPVAIDNKIEQAMDLVKTHLTSAVREEVDILRSTIADLEGRVSLLEGENQILRQFAPTEIIANLSSLVQKQQREQQPQKAAASGSNATGGGGGAPQKVTIQTVPSAPVIMDQHQQQYHQTQQQHQYTSPQPPSAVSSGGGSSTAGGSVTASSTTPSTGGGPATDESQQQ